jgi:hypothetical protein
MKPLLGILAADDRYPFRGNPLNFAAIIRTARSRGYEMVVITPTFLRDRTSTVSCFRLLNKHGRPRWQQTTVPTPSVFYNRLPDRTYERRADVQSILKQLQKEPHIDVFNPRFFDKWQLFQMIRQSSDLARLLPETHSLDEPETLQKLLQKHGSLVAKPIHGKAGIGMMRLSQSSSGYQLQYQNEKQKRTFHLNKATTLWKTLQTLKGRQDYLLQQCIPLALFAGRPYDLRALLQKNGHGRWGITGIGVRVAGPKAVSTHVPMGGRIAPLSLVLNQTFGSQQKQIRAKIEETTLKLAHYIDQHEKGRLGEMSMDLGIEENGEIWFFEANAKPMKFDEPSIRRRSLQNIVDFALYLQRQQRGRVNDAYSSL